MNAISQKGGLLIISLERRRGDPKEEEEQLECHNWPGRGKKGEGKGNENEGERLSGEKKKRTSFLPSSPLYSPSPLPLCLVLKGWFCSGVRRSGSSGGRGAGKPLSSTD